MPNGRIAFAHEALDAIIIDLKLAAKVEDIAIELAVLTIENKNIILYTGVSGGTLRGIMEATNKNLPTLIPAIHKVLVDDI